MATRCNGGPSQLVGAAAGYRKLGWGNGRLGFAQCPNPGACAVQSHNISLNEAIARTRDIHQPQSEAISLGTRKYAYARPRALQELKQLQDESSSS